MERRRYPRVKSLYGGIIAFNARQSTISCIVRNFNPAGAKVTVSGTTLLPDEFDLSIARKETSYRARLVWRHNLDVGVQFTANSSPELLPLDVARKLQTRKAEVEMLKRRVADLAGTK